MHVVVHRIATAFAGTRILARRAVALALVLGVAGRALQAQVAENDPVRTFETVSVVSMSASLALGIWSYRAPSVPSISMAYASAAVGYGMLLTGLQTESVSRKIVLGHVVASAAAATLATLGVMRFQREAQAKRREELEQVRVTPSLSSSRAGLTIAWRF